MTNQLLVVPKQTLKRPLGTLSDEWRDAVTRALDLLFTGV